jgi:hypothetical protein
MSSEVAFSFKKSILIKRDGQGPASWPLPIIARICWLQPDWVVSDTHMILGSDTHQKRMSKFFWLTRHINMEYIKRVYE